MSKSALTKNECITRHLEKEIAEGGAYGNNKLESIRNLAKRFDTTPATICKAVDNLHSQGLIEKQHGRGIFIRRSNVNHSVALASEQRFFMPESGWYCPVLIGELEANFRKRGYGVQYFLNITSKFCEENFDFALERRSFKAVVFVSQWFFENKRVQVEAEDIPCVGVFRNGDLRYWVTVDSAWFFTEALEEFKKLNRKRVAHIRVRPELDWNEYGRQIHRKSMNAAEAAFGKSMIIQVPPSSQAGFEAMKNLWKEKKPDGVIVTDERIGQGVVAAVMSLGLRVPQDIVVASEVLEGGNKILGIPIIEIRTPVRDQANIIAEMVSLICSGQKLEEPQVFLRQSLMNPFTS
jgi:DNA-binding LacI/PurR family transcriptional regulator